VIPVIISSDKTQLTLFRGKTAYPVYLTIGNIPKEIRRKPSRRAQVLIAYIPTTKLEGIANKAGRRRAMANLYHSCMQVILAPIAACGETGIPMMSGDGVWRRCHPIYASFVGDYPEQVLVTCTYSSRCPKCLVPSDELGSYARFPPRDYDQARDAYLLADGDAHAFHSACRAAGQKPVYHPFWESLPLTNVFVSITPDILHQLLQGVLKHLIAWLIGIFGPAEIDARCRSLPPNHHISIFAKGISTLSRVTGKEHKNMSRLLLGLIMDLPVPNGQVSPRIIAAVRALLDFLYLAQLPSHTSTTIARLDESLSRFHDNKDVFVDLGIRDHFNLPKIHSLLHYIPSIRLFGTTDNYNTEQTERLHIDFAKDAYRATNRKDEYSQMTTWLERREKVQVHSTFIKWRQQPDQVPSARPIGPPRPGARTLRMCRHATLKSVSFDDLAQKYGAIDFQDTLADFIAQTNHPTASGATLSRLAADTLIPFRSVPVHHRIKFTNMANSEIVDVVFVRPEQKDTRGRPIPSRFDTVLVSGKSQGGGVLHGNNGELSF
jgi:Plavaka transposase